MGLRGPKKGQKQGPRTERVLAVLRLIDQGVTDKEIAARMNLSPQAVRDTRVRHRPDRVNPPPGWAIKHQELCETLVKLAAAVDQLRADVDRLTAWSIQAAGASLNTKTEDPG